MSTDTTVPVPTDNAATQQPVVKDAGTPPAASADNGTPLSPEKKEEYSRLLNDSKAEALRLKAEVERLAAEKAQLEAKYSQPNDVSDQDVEILKQLGKKAGFAFQEDTQKIRQETYAEKQQAAVDEFLKTHPEYSPGKPENDQRWNALRAELATYVSPTNGSDWKKYLEKGHKVLNTNDELTLERGKALGFAQANTAPSVGGASSGSPSQGSGKTPERQAISEGFAAARPQYYKN